MTGLTEILLGVTMFLGYSPSERQDVLGPLTAQIVDAIRDRGGPDLPIKLDTSGPAWQAVPGEEIAAIVSRARVTGTTLESELRCPAGQKVLTECRLAGPARVIALGKPVFENQRASVPLRLIVQEEDASSTYIILMRATFERGASINATWKLVTLRTIAQT